MSSQSHPFIPAGAVRLPGLPRCFLGGACGLVAPDILAMPDAIGTHPDSGASIDFCYKHSVRIIVPCRGECIDVGSIVPLTGKV